MAGAQKDVSGWHKEKRRLFSFKLQKNKKPAAGRPTEKTVLFREGSRFPWFPWHPTCKSGNQSYTSVHRGWSKLLEVGFAMLHVAAAVVAAVAAAGCLWLVVGGLHTQ